MNKTQCPHCFTVYQITDEQLVKSKGNVRCGNCHERFKASLVADSDLKKREPKAQPNNDLFAGVKQPAAKDLALEERNKRALRQRAEPKLDQEANSLTSSAKLNERESGQLKTGIDKTDKHKFDAPNKPASSTLDEEEDDFDDFDLPDRFTHFIEEPSLGELSEPNYDDDDSETSFDFDLATEPEDLTTNDLLIDELDRMVDNKLVERTKKPVKAIDWGTETATDDLDSPSEDADLFVQADEESDDDFDYESYGRSGSRPRVSFGRLLSSLILLLLGVLGVLALGYQIWLMPNPSVRNNQFIQTSLNNTFNPLLDYVDGFGLVLDRPSDLAGISLVSAQSEPHPRRASTTLLRLSFLNKSSITQSLPWLELTLTNEAGAVVARRALDPSDYLHNNAIIDEIGPHELKKITVELLAFPKQATGFELRMLGSPPE